MKLRMSKRIFQVAMTGGLAILLWLGAIGIGGTGAGFRGMPAAIAFTNQQQMVMEVWRIVNRSYVDETFN
ncbi:MAG: carboxyl-terminal protease, partial [Cyanobacteria bacterium J06606_4]